MPRSQLINSRPRQNAALLTRAKLLHRLKGDLDRVVMKCLEQDRTRRYEMENRLVADLTRHLTNEPVLARPPSSAYKFQKVVRRKKLAFWAAAVFAALAVGLVFSLWSLLRERKARISEQAHSPAGS